jgi:putative hemolysin
LDALIHPHSQGYGMHRQVSLRKGRYLARIADAQDISAAFALRALCFGPQDRDAFDARCSHVVIEADGTIVGAFRVLALTGADIGQSYSAQFYDLARLAAYPGPLLEMGRFCIHPDQSDPDILRMAWGFLTRLVDANGVRLLFGCASFAGDDATRYLAAFGRLYARHQAPAGWQPGKKADDVFDFAPLAGHGPGDAAGLPPLLRSYLALGGWVSDHAVHDRALHTMHVFTGVEIAAIPPARARLLRALAGEAAAAVTP